MISAVQEIKTSRENLAGRFSRGEITGNFPVEYSEICDQYFRRSLQDSETGRRIFRERTPLALVAVGGYGRRELCHQSDVDIIILFGSKIPKMAKALADELFFPLWDQGFDLGYGVRILKDCWNLSKNDFSVLTSLMDARFIAGDSKLFFTLNEKLTEKIIRKKAKDFSVWLEENKRSRMLLYGDASHLLEPNLKEGIGGLRDFHHMLWAAKAHFEIVIPKDLEHLGKLTNDEYTELINSLEFIWLVRNHLHFLSNRKNDRLDFENQEKIAVKLGFKDKKGMLGVEQFLGKLHSVMTYVKEVSTAFTDDCIPGRTAGNIDSVPAVLTKGIYRKNGRLYFDSATSILSNPLLLIYIFEHSAITGSRLSMESKRLVREFLHLIDSAFRGSSAAAQSFRTTINSRGSNVALEQMFETGLLETYIPEFGRIKDRVQYDAYHIFPVGSHLLETLNFLKELSDQKELLLLDIFSGLAGREPLFFAAMLHDIGKAEKGHAEKGAEIAGSILERFGITPDEIADVMFLIKNHLLLAETATRRDLNDEKAVVQFARRVGNVERLKMLYLLTWADSMATGPRAWNEWTANLVQELFFKAIHIFEKEEFATPSASEKVESTRKEVANLLAGRMENYVLESFFDIMSPGYLLNTEPHEIVEHLSIFEEYKVKLRGNEAKPFVLKAVEDEAGDCWDVTVMAGDRPGVFADIAGVLALNNINILSAEIYTWRDGTALDIFKVTKPLDNINPGQTWTRVEQDMQRTFAGKLSLEYQIGKKAAPSILSKGKQPSRPSRVVIDNEASDFFTLVEVFADDRVGLLYLITRSLFELRLDIRIAKIATKGDQVADVFYVRDLVGQKVEDEEQIQEIRKALLYQLER